MYYKSSGMSILFLEIILEFDRKTHKFLQIVWGNMIDSAAVFPYNVCANIIQSIL